MRRDERGMGQFLLAVLITAALGGIGLGLAAFQDVMAMRSGQWDPKDKSGAGPPAAVTIPFIGPAPSSDPETQACITRAASQRGLQWAGAAKGWRAPGSYPEPQLTGDNARDRGTVSAWQSQIQSLIDDVKPQWDACGSQPPQETTSTTEAEQKPDIAGTYTFTYSGATPAGCTMNAPAQMQVSMVGSNRVRFGTSTGGIEAGLAGDYSFDGQYTQGAAQGRIHGRFARWGDDTLIRNGGMEVTLGGDGCAVAFEARRQR